MTPAVLGVAVAGGTTARVPANRSARRARARVAQLRRLGLELAVIVAAVLSGVALRQRGVVGDDGGGGDLTAASAVTWMAVAGGRGAGPADPPALRWMLRRTRRATGGVPLFVAARLVRSGARVLPVVVVVVAVSGTTFAAAFAATPRDGQAAGALSVVGGDARLDARPRRVPHRRGAGRRRRGRRPCRRSGAGRGRVSTSRRTAARRSSGWPWSTRPPTNSSSRRSELPDAPRLARLRSGAGVRVPATVPRHS